MATIKSEYYRFNGVSWDIHYFKTTMDMVDGLQGVLDGKAPLPLASLRNFVDGTTINTNIDYSQTNGAPFLLRIYGNTYGRQIPTETVIQGYIYNDTIIQYGGYSVGTPITGLVALNVEGKLTFWFPRQGYWEGYFAEVFDVSGAGGKVNLVTSILDTAKPVGTKEVVFSNILNTVMNNDARLTNARPASDVYAWAKAASKPSYSWSEITSKPAWIGANKPDYTWSELLARPDVIIEGDARLTNARPASDVSAWAKAASKPSYSWSEITSKPSFATVATSGSYDDLTNKPSIPTIPSVMTATEGQTGSAATQRTISAAILKSIILYHSPAGSRPASDVSAWAKEASKPSYSWSEIGSKPAWILSSKPDYAWSEILAKPSVMDTTEGNAGTATTERTINAANLKAIILNHSPAGARSASDVYAWAKAANKPSYSWSEIGSKPAWIGANKPDYAWSEILAKPSWIGASKPSYSWSEIGSKPSEMTATEGQTGSAATERTISAAILKSIILHHSPAGSRPASDVSAWAKEANRPTYTWSDITSKPAWILSSKPDYAWSEILAKPTVMTATEGNAGTATTERTINAANLKSIILNHSPAGSRPASDVASWAKAASKPSYSWNEINDKPKVVLNASTSIYNDIVIKTANDTISLESSTDSFHLSDEGIPSLHCGPNSDGLFEVYGSISSRGTIDASGDIFTKSRRVQKQSTPVNISTSTTLGTTHLDTMIVCRNASAMTLTIPVQTTLGTPPHGTEIHFFQYGAGKTTISPASGVTIVSKGSKRAIDGQYAAATLKLIDNNVWILVGALQS